MWVDYTRCEVIRFFTWQPENNDQLTEMEARFDGLEPFGSAAEVAEAFETLNLLVLQYDFDETGNLFDDGNATALDVFAAANGGFTLNWNSDNAIMAGLMQAQCETRLSTVYSAYIGAGLCIVWAYLYTWGILQWCQFFFDLACYWFFIRYVFLLLKEFTG